MLWLDVARGTTRGTKRTEVETPFCPTRFVTGHALHTAVIERQLIPHHQAEPGAHHRQVCRGGDAGPLAAPHPRAAHAGAVHGQR
jgi:hypothetical protein